MSNDSKKLAWNEFGWPGMVPPRSARPRTRSDEKGRVRELNRGSVAVFYEGDLPHMASGCEQSACGFSLYQGILVIWDEDQDTRVLDFIDNLLPEAQEQLLVVQEHEGCIRFVWDHYCPHECEGEIEVRNDSWCVESSLVLRPWQQSDRSA
jgi:hypothetical protein